MCGKRIRFEQAALNRMSTGSFESSPGLSAQEYTRRKDFLDNLKGLSKAEYIEIVKILRKHDVHISENQNGIFFNVASLSQSVFDDLEHFLRFTQMNRKNLADRDYLLSTLRAAPPLEESS
jgi:hypothetical protein